jgi:hypothetical protein
VGVIVGEDKAGGVEVEYGELYQLFGDGCEEIEFREGG